MPIFCQGQYFFIFKEDEHKRICCNLTKSSLQRYSAIREITSSTKSQSLTCKALNKIFKCYPAPVNSTEYIRTALPIILPVHPSLPVLVPIQSISETHLFGNIKHRQLMTNNYPQEIYLPLGPALKHNFNPKLPSDCMKETNFHLGLPPPIIVTSLVVIPETSPVNSNRGKRNAKPITLNCASSSTRKDNGFSDSTSLIRPASKTNITSDFIFLKPDTSTTSSTTAL